MSTTKRKSREGALEWQTQVKREGLNTKRVHSVGHYVSSCKRTRTRKRVHSCATQPSSDVPVQESHSSSEDIDNSCTEQTSGRCVSRPSGDIAAQRGLPAWVTQSRLLEEDINTFSRPVSDLPIQTVIVRNLARLGVSQLFPVQAHVIPELIFSARADFPRDVVVCAPTGCGKTLAYVVPVVSALMNRVVCQVRALVVVPSHELASQVTQVFSSVMAGTALRAGVLSEDCVVCDKLSHPPSSTVDVLVSTPGKLTEHLSSFPPTTLRSLHYLILDEADKLLKQSSSPWLSHLLALIASHKTPCQTSSLRNTLIGRCANPHEIMLLQSGCSECECSASVVNSPLRKLLLSATMTFDPALLAALGLHRPLLFSVPSAQLSKDADSAFTIPQQLKEAMVRCTLEEKPLVLVHLVREEVARGGRVLCFTNSRETAHRLYLLLRELSVVCVDELSSSLTQGRRTEALSRLRNGNTHVLVCSDHMARGMDLDTLSCVVNYDPPRQFGTYLHRAGRTARAGKGGIVYTLLSGDEVHSFKTLMRRSRGGAVEETSIAPDNLQSYREHYISALERLQALSG